MGAPEKNHGDAERGCAPLLPGGKYHTRGDKGVWDKPDIAELEGSPAWNWVRVAENTSP